MDGGLDWPKKMEWIISLQFTESQSPRMVWVGWDVQAHAAPAGMCVPWQAGGRSSHSSAHSSYLGPFQPDQAYPPALWYQRNAEDSLQVIQDSLYCLKQSARRKGILLGKGGWAYIPTLFTAPESKKLHKMDTSQILSRLMALESSR